VSDVQPSFTDIEYAQRRRVTKRDEFLTMMDEIIPWDQWVSLVKPFYYNNTRGRQPRRLETMLRMSLLQVWFSLSDEAVEDQVNDSYAMRRFMRLDFTVEQVPDATTLLHFRHVMEAHELGKVLFDAQNRFFTEHGWIMRGGSVVDATLIAAPSSTKNAEGVRDPQMHQTRKGSQWYFGMKTHTGVDAGTGYVHSVAVTGANAHDLSQVALLVRDDDEVVYADAGYLGVDKRDDVAGDQHLSQVEFRVAARPGKLRTMTPWEREIESRKASVRAKVEHVFLIVKRDFGFRKTRYRGLGKNLNRMYVVMASANWVMRGRAVKLAG
jgi:IS5 family transposase